MASGSGFFVTLCHDYRPTDAECCHGDCRSGVLVRLSSAMLGSPWLTVISDSLMILGGFVAALMAVLPLVAAGMGGLQPTAGAGMRSEGADGAVARRAV